MLELQDGQDPIDTCYWIVQRQKDRAQEQTGIQDAPPRLDDEPAVELPADAPEEAGPIERRYPARRRKPPTTLQMTFANKKRYEETVVESGDDVPEYDLDDLEGDGGDSEVESVDSATF